MRFSALLTILLAATGVNAQSPATKLWNDLKNKREALPSIHQEFEVTQTYKSTNSAQSSHRVTIIDMSQGKWRETLVSGSGERIRVFDGQDLFQMEKDEDEFVRTKRNPRGGNPEPGPYGGDLDWDKEKEVERVACGFAQNDHTCIVMDIPVKQSVRLTSASEVTRMVAGVARLAIDSENGMLIQSHTNEAIETSRSGYTFDVTYAVTKSSYGGTPDATLFKLPDGVHEVKVLSRWNVARIKKQLIGKAAPELEVSDIQGNRVSLSDFKGKTVLLDFWTTWCPPCQHDAPALDKLYQKYGGKDLMIVGISLSEERQIVETFLKKHPHGFPVVLTTENDMPRPYQIGVFPTYMVIAPDGTLTTAVEGDQGFGDLRKFLLKSGLEPD